MKKQIQSGQVNTQTQFPSQVSRVNKMSGSLQICEKFPQGYFYPIFVVTFSDTLIIGDDYCIGG